MTSFYDYSTDNDKIKHIYGNYNLWSWLRYWYLDTSAQTSLMLIDKGYYDYDYERIEKPVTYEDSVKSDEETERMLSFFGIGPNAERLQEIARQDIDD